MGSWWIYRSQNSVMKDAESMFIKTDDYALLLADEQKQQVII